MKSLLLLLPIFIVLSCSKEVAEKPPTVKSVTYLRQHYDINNRLVKVDTSIHWCRVSGADLARFELMNKAPHYVCATSPEIWLQLTITQACPAVIEHNKQATK